MALAPCIECGHEISSEAKACPNCGARNRHYKSKVVWYWLVVAALGVSGFLAYDYLANGDYVTSCDTRGKRESFAKVIDDASFAQLKKLQ